MKYPDLIAYRDDLDEGEQDFLEVAGSWLINQLKPGQLIQLDIQRKGFGHLFLHLEWDENGEELPKRPMVEVQGGIWVMFLSKEELDDEFQLTWMKVIHDGYIMRTCILNFLQWFDKQGLLPKEWREKLSYEGNEG